MRMSRIFSVAAVLCLASSAAATTVTIGGANDSNIATDVKDATIFQNNVNNSNGAGPGMFAGTNGMTSPRRGLIEFNVAGHVPPGATINSVTLELFLGQTAGGAGGAFNIGLFTLSKGWGEGTTESGGTISGTGQGAAANAGDATWNASAFPSTLWTKPGGDFASTASASTSVGSTLNAASNWSSAAMVTDVQNWLNTPSTNFGWAVVNADEADA
ncbi:MAG TPA: DNRLRE domain-containing protein, partial [Pirellulales bacterium]